MLALGTGFLTGFSLIIAIGAQNAFVIKQGLRRQHISMIVSICAASDAALICLGTGGLGALLQREKALLELVRWFGVAYLIWFGINSMKSAFHHQAMSSGIDVVPGALQVALTCLGFTFLNPHVYLDTVIFLGSLANQFEENRWFFALGGSLASVTWFVVIGFGAKAASVYMAKPSFWKVLDLSVAVVMFAVALTFAFHNF